EVEVVLAGVPWHRRVEEEALTNVDATEELPVPLELGLEHSVGSALRKALQSFVELRRTEDSQYHALVKVLALPVDAHGFANQGAATVAAHEVIRLDDLGLASMGLATGLLFRVGRPAEEGLCALGHGRKDDLHTIAGILDAIGAPTIQGLHGGQLSQARPQDLLRAVLRQAL